ncbi:MAG: FAD-binding and (Fe-S)-binding domain-containing protein [Candidatus Methanoperedens sp.]|nr:FAD-binding and (Fe-S)-binding domain-containing protein [Candidatus Methanoperedens sp.]PKL53123.1 MAG: Fe-S oxidoreductase [Candidatus Methanoperedenaceae archaeon HGW-Methanoperedenaceae-1]
MSKLNTGQRAYLEEQFGSRLTFDRSERKLYGHDIASIPNMVKPLVGDTIPDAVVQPVNENELVELVKWANKQKLPLTPRGKATSGYGGAVPVKNGIVVDFYRMKDVVTFDKDKPTVTVQPGITWEKLDNWLMSRNLTLRLYPTSYPSSTVGGWLAQGGAGIGSYEFGFFNENVVSARVVLPTGEARNFTGKELGLVSDAEGITGFISEVTLHVQPKEDVDVVSIACPDAHDTQGLVNSIIEAGLPIWSMVFINPHMAELKNKAPLMEEHGHPAEERVLLPEAYILTLAFRAGDSGTVRTGLQELVKTCNAEILSNSIATEEWEHRFKLMVVKRLGPSLVPAEVIVPLSKLGDVMAEIERTVNQPVVKEGVIIRNGANGEPEAVILGFIPSDQRKFSYNFVFGLVLTIMKIAEKHGGRPYATGLYFSKKADSVLGKNRVEKLRAFKSEIDPAGIMNPGKVLGGGMLGTALNIASSFEPLIRPFGNAVTTRIGEMPGKDVRGIPADVAWYAYSCSQCGYCVDECDQFYGRGWESQSPRGKWYWLREYMEGREEWNQKMVDTILVCTTCELCNLRCSAALPIEPSWMKLRGLLIHEEKRMTIPPFEMMTEALRAQGDIWAGYRKDRSLWFPEDMKEKHGVGTKAKNVYFAGCTASFVEKDIGIASVRLLDEAGVDFTYLGAKENCCATPMLVAGKWDVFEETMKKNISAVKASGADTVITSCPACDMMWRHVYPDWANKLGIEYGITSKHYSEILSEKIKSGGFKFKSGAEKPVTVTLHDSCHMGRVSGVYEPPRDLIKAIPNVTYVEMSHNREKAHCCGSVLTLLKDPPVAADIGGMRLNEAVEAGAEKILALCPCCQFQLRVSADAKNVPVEVVDLAHFAASALGYEFPDPNPEVRAQWAVFEKMIVLMTPQGFADIMGTMWPELIESMPYGMGRMMRVMGKVPYSLELMKPMFPVLFPILLPKMMPKVMDTMLVRVGERIPMPDYMAEQMPDSP